MQEREAGLSLQARLPSFDPYLSILSCQNRDLTTLKIEDPFINHTSLNFFKTFF